MRQPSVHHRADAALLSLAVLVVLGGCGTGDSTRSIGLATHTSKAVTPGITCTAGTGSPDSNRAAATATAEALISIGHGAGDVLYDPARDATADITSALRLAAQHHRRVLIDFGADWCPDCRVLGQLYHAPAVAPVLAHDYVLVTVDVGQGDHNLSLAQRYGDAIRVGIPALVVLDPSGRVITTTADGAFADARSMTADDVLAFLTRWSAGDQ